MRNLSVGGIQRLAVDDVNELARRGNEVWVITLEPELSPESSLKRALNIPSTNIILMPYPRFRNIKSFFTLIHALRAIRPDVLMTHQWFANTVGRLTALFASVPTVLSFEHSTDEARKPLVQLFIDYILQYACHRVVAVSEAVGDSLLRQGISRAHVRVVENGINLAVYRGGYTRRAGNQFVYIGRLVADKNVDVLLRAFQKVPDASLEIVGDGPERERLVTLAEELALANRVHFSGIVINSIDVLRKAYCLILPSKREGFGLVALEALASGVPVIVSEVVAQHGFVRDGENGLVVKTGDVGALAQAVHRMANDTALVSRLAATAPRGLERFSIEAHVDKILAL